MVNISPIADSIEWIISPEPVDYENALTFMDQRVDSIIRGEKPECIWLLEHPPVYTAGTSAKETDLLNPAQFPVFKAGRGGQYTYHGPGQRIAYIMLDLNKRGRDVRWFVGEVENWVIDVCAQFGIDAEKREGRVGLWVETNEAGLQREKKIAAIGIRLRKWVSFHGVSLNIAPDLTHYSGIIPCGIANYGVTSFQKLGLNIDQAMIDQALQLHFLNHFNHT